MSDVSETNPSNTEQKIDYVIDIEQTTERESNMSDPKNPEDSITTVINHTILTNIDQLLHASGSTIHSHVQHTPEYLDHSNDRPTEIVVENDKVIK